MLNIKKEAVSLENAVDNVAANGSPGSENSSISHLLPKLLALFFEHAVFASIWTRSRPRLGDLEGHVSIIRRLGEHHGRAFLVEDIDIGSRENSF